MAHVRTFETGATRDDDNKPDPEGYWSPWVMDRYDAYMLAHQTLPDGTRRASDNWQLGIPIEEYMKSLMRHCRAVWKAHRSGRVDQEALCGVMFNSMGILHEDLKKPKQEWWRTPPNKAQ